MEPCKLRRKYEDVVELTVTTTPISDNQGLMSLNCIGIKNKVAGAFT